jgi:hypothetical protein
VSNVKFPEPDEKDIRKEVIEELKVVQDILLKQESYALTALYQSFAIVGGLVLALLSEKTKLDRYSFLYISEVVFFSFLYVQAIYREAFHQGLRRSFHLQRLLGNRQTGEDKRFDPFMIYENVHHPLPTWKSFADDLTNPRFIFPNLILFLIPIIVFYLRHA